ncbi:hypothetical protein TELCIR_06874 [Teladorsagia circumcincta]|uniref:Uncharacterized protein n=1 Tax=Teladorsagia circumcincta TaxID=45464 RepID=A0A2G9ULU4_TELCI|nr:hypothetical protein TELCIR_06874 [Teladorsagia circumcincta]
MVDLTGLLEWITPMALALFTSTVLTCVSSRTKYTKGVQLQADNDSDQPKRKSAHSVIHSIGRLFRSNKGTVPSQPANNWSTETIVGTAIEQQDGSLREDVVVSPPVLPPRVRIHRRAEYQPLPRAPLPCLAYKFGAPDGIDRRDVEDIFEPRDPSIRETASYGDTYVLPAPSAESVETD